jgi:hypothetical protein
LKVNYGEYLAFQTPETVADGLNAYGNFGRIIVTQKKVDLDGPCPKHPSYCGNLLDTDLLLACQLSSRGADSYFYFKIMTSIIS